MNYKHHTNTLAFLDEVHWCVFTCKTFVLENLIYSQFNLSLDATYELWMKFTLMCDTAKKKLPSINNIKYIYDTISHEPAYARTKELPVVESLNRVKQKRYPIEMWQKIARKGWYVSSGFPYVQECTLYVSLESNWNLKPVFKRDCIRSITTHGFFSRFHPFYSVANKTLLHLFPF